MTSTPSAASARASCVEQVGERHRHLHPVAVVRVGDGVDDGHRARQRELELAPVWARASRASRRVHAALAAAARRSPSAPSPCSGRRGCPISTLRAKSMPSTDFEKAVHEMLARLLAVGDDVDAAILLQLEREQRGVALGVVERGAGKPPRRPQLVRLGEPGRLRQAAGDGGRRNIGAPPPGASERDPHRVRPASSHRANRSARAAAVAAHAR